MSSKRKERIFVLCEDKQQDFFIRHFFITLGWEKHQIRVLTAPSGRGSGEQFVRENYRERVADYRKLRNHQNVALVVMTDADS